MTEIELKLQLPEATRAAVERAVGTAASRRTRLQAIYFDTADRRLAAAGLALRLRKEGRRWVQTLKSGSAHGLERGEHNVPLALVAGLTPSVDPARHAGTPAGDALAAALAARDGAAPPRLEALYRTDIVRRHRELRTRGGVVELALDRGNLIATGPDGVERRWPVAELEIELLRGAPRAVTEVGRRWAARHGLWPDTRTKAERGDRLAYGLPPGAPVPAVKAVPVSLHKSLSPAAAWAAVLDNLLAQALPNWSELAGGSRAADALHQLRVALRRLRSAERFFAGWPGVPAAPWNESVAALFRALGTTRDSDVLEGGLKREVDAALLSLGAPALDLPPAAHAAAWGERDSAAHGLLFIDLLAERLTPAVGCGPVPGGASADANAALEPAAGDATLRELTAARLQDWHVQALRDAKRFDRLDDEARHRLRKRLKRLRYAVEFSAGLYGRRAVERYLDRLRDAQERLGEFNDVCVAVAAYRPLAATEPRAWFALGWLAARRTAVLALCSSELGRFRKAEPFWR
jgi:triphosphatase